MTRPFIAICSLTLTLFSRSPGSYIFFTFGTFEVGTNCHIWHWKIFIMSVDASVKDLPNLHQPDHFDLYEGHISKKHFQWKSMGFDLNRHIILRPSQGPTN